MSKEKQNIKLEKVDAKTAYENLLIKYAELETENNKLLDVINNQDVKIADLEQKLEQTEKDLADYQFNYPTIKELEKENAEQYKHQSTEEELEFVEHLHYFPKYFKKTFIDGYHECQKKHEWHYPSKGELPKDEKKVLVYMWGSFYIGSYKQYTDDNNAWHFNDFDEESEQITAWQEIVTPKDSE